ncbi:LOC733236 [Pelobates cultripes]|uniref:LOC733236, partial n=1 Tax=Pelobates cultripes TaxID=61616 RepID=A0AAD1T9U6_PELCU|nr:LOC733236 [Pelobates cultripes]
MEFPGCCFEDSVFSESRDRTVGVGVPYKAKQCEPQWFNEDLNREDCTEIITALKFRGDLAYRHEDYEKALVAYNRCYLLLPRTNAAMRRDVQESQARCLVCLRRYTEALEVAQTLKGSVFNTDQLTCALNLHITIYSRLRDWFMAVSCLQQLISLHPYNPWMWKKLAEFYLRLLLDPSQYCLSEEAQSIIQSTRPKLVNEHDYADEEQPCLDRIGRNVDILNDMDNTSRTVLDSSNPSLINICTKAELWINSCASFIRARRLFQLVQPQQASFVLENNLKAQDEIEERLKECGIDEETQMLMTEIMAEDISNEGTKEEVDSKTTMPLSSFTIPSDVEFRAKWFEKMNIISLPSCTKIQSCPR